MLQNTVYSFSAPGSTMLLGEHAVLHGYYSIVAAVEQRIHVKLTPLTDRRVLLFSELGELQTTLDELTVERPFQFVIAAIKRYLSSLTFGMKIEITADFSSTVGLGSSAAVTVACVAVLRQMLALEIKPETLFNEALVVIKDVQGVGSGADVAASVFGGVLLYRATPFELMPLNVPPAIGLFYSGSKTPTVDVIRYVEKKFAEQREELLRLYQQINDCVLAGKAALQAKDWVVLGQVFDQQQQLMQQLGVNNEAIQKIINELANDESIYGRKISGSGLGDCVIALAANTKALDAYSQLNYIPMKIAQIGVRQEI